MTAKVPTPPLGERGYRVDLDSGLIHLRYAAHAPNALKVSTPAGVLNVLNGTKPRACRDCFPHGTRTKPQSEAPSRGQRRRTHA